MQSKFKLWIRIVSAIVAFAFLFNDIAYGLSPAIVSSEMGKGASTRDDMYALGQKLFGARRGPGSLNLDIFKPQKFAGEAPAIPGITFAVDYSKPPAGWENNPILQKTNLIEALEYFRDNEARISTEKLEIKEGYFDVDETKGELPISRIERHGDRYILVVHTKFVQMWNHIREHDVWFEADINGTKRTMSAAWGLFYRLAKHEMSDLKKEGLVPKSIGHITYYPDKDLGITEDEITANTIGGKYNLINDTIWMWFLGSYCFGDTTRYDNYTLARRLRWFFRASHPDLENLRKEFPSMIEADKEEAFQLACAINFRFFGDMKKVPEFEVKDDLVKEGQAREARMTAPPLYVTGSGDDQAAGDSVIPSPLNMFAGEFADKIIVERTNVRGKPKEQVTLRAVEVMQLRDKLNDAQRAELIDALKRWYIFSSKVLVHPSVINIAIYMLEGGDAWKQDWLVDHVDRVYLAISDTDVNGEKTIGVEGFAAAHKKDGLSCITFLEIRPDNRSGGDVAPRFIGVGAQLLSYAAHEETQRLENGFVFDIIVPDKLSKYGLRTAKKYEAGDIIRYVRQRSVETIDRLNRSIAKGDEGARVILERLKTANGTTYPKTPPDQGGGVVSDSKRVRRQGLNRAQWISLLQGLVKKLPPGTPPTLKNVAGVSEGKLTAQDMRQALTNHNISYEEAGIVRERIKPFTLVQLGLIAHWEGEEGQARRIVGRPRERMPPDEAILQETIDKVNQLIESLTPQDRELAYQILDGLNYAETDAPIDVKTISDLSGVPEESVERILTRLKSGFTEQDKTGSRPENDGKTYPKTPPDQGGGVVSDSSGLGVFKKALLGDKSTALQTLEENGISAVYMDSPLFLIDDKGKPIDSPGYNKTKQGLERIPFYEIRPKIIPYKLIEVRKKEGAEPSEVDIVSRATIVLHELLSNSAHVFDGKSGRKMIIGARAADEGRSVKVFSIDTGSGIDDIPRAVETQYSGLKEELRIHGLGSGAGLTTATLGSLFMFKGGELTVDSRGKRFSYSYDTAKGTVVRRELKSLIGKQIGTYIELTLPVPKEKFTVIYSGTPAVVPYQESTSGTHPFGPNTLGAAEIKKPAGRDEAGTLSKSIPDPFQVPKPPAATLSLLWGGYFGWFAKVTLTFLKRVVMNMLKIEKNEEGPEANSLPAGSPHGAVVGRQAKSAPESGKELQAMLDEFLKIVSVEKLHPLLVPLAKAIAGAFVNDPKLKLDIGSLKKLVPVLATLDSRYKREAANMIIEFALMNDDGSFLGSAIDMLSDISISVDARQMLVNIIGVYLKRIGIHIPSDMVKRLTSVSDEKLKGTIFDNIIEPLYFKAPELFSGDTIKRIVASYINDAPAAKYLLFYASMHESGPPLYTEKNFPLHGRIKNLIANGKKRILFVYNIADGIGDQLLVGSTMLQSLLDVNPELEITALTPRPYLYDNPRIHSQKIGDIVSQPGDYDIVIYARTDAELYMVAYDSLLDAYLKAHPKTFYVEVNKHPDFGGKKIGSDNDCIAFTYWPFGSRYKGPFHTCAELGLPFRYGTSANAHDVYVKDRYPAAEDYWRNNIDALNKENKPVVIFNPFGGEIRSKGVNENNKEHFMKILEALVDKQYFVVMLPNQQSWGSVQKAEDLKTGLSEDARRNIAIAQAPKRDPRLYKYMIDRADGVVTVEGGLGHLAYNLGKPMVAILTESSGEENEWIPLGSDWLQGAMGSRYYGVAGSARFIAEFDIRGALGTLSTSIPDLPQADLLSALRSAIDSRDLEETRRLVAGIEKSDSRTNAIVLTPQEQSIAHFLKSIKDKIVASGVEDATYVLTAIDEFVANILRHSGMRETDSTNENIFGAGFVRIVPEEDGITLECVFQDNGRGHGNLVKMYEYIIAATSSERLSQESGRGIFLLHSLIVRNFHNAELYFISNGKRLTFPGLDRDRANLITDDNSIKNGMLANLRFKIKTPPSAASPAETIVPNETVSIDISGISAIPQGATPAAPPAEPAVRQPTAEAALQIPPSEKPRPGEKPRWSPPEEVNRVFREEQARTMNEARVFERLKKNAERRPRLNLRVKQTRMRLGFPLDIRPFVAEGVAPVRIIKDSIFRPRYFAIVDELNPSNYAVFKVDILEGGRRRISAIGYDGDEAVVSSCDSNYALGSFRAGKAFYARLANRKSHISKADCVYQSGAGAGNPYSHISFTKSNGKQKGIIISLVPVTDGSQDRYWLTPGSAYDKDEEGQTVFACLIDLKNERLKRPPVLPGLKEIESSGGKFVAYPPEIHSAQDWLKVNQNGAYQYFQNIGMIEEGGRPFVVYRRIDKEDRITAINIAPDRGSFTVEGLELDGKPIIFEADNIYLSTLLYLLTNDNEEDLGFLPADVKSRLSISPKLRNLVCDTEHIARQFHAKIPTSMRQRMIGGSPQWCLGDCKEIHWMSRWGDEVKRELALKKLGAVRQELMSDIAGVPVPLHPSEPPAQAEAPPAEPAARQSTAEEAQRENAKRNRGDRLELAAGLPEDGEISDKLNRELDKAREADKRSPKVSFKGKKRTGASKWDLLDEFRKDLEDLPNKAVENLKKSKSLGEQRRILVENRISHAGTIDGKFLHPEIERLLKERSVAEEVLVQDPRLKHGGQGRHLKAYGSDNFDYIVKTYNTSDMKKQVQVLWIGNGFEIAQMRLNGLAVPTMVIDATRDNKRPFTYILQNAGSQRTDLAIIQKRVTPLLEHLKVLTRSGEVAQAKLLIDEFKQHVIALFRRGVVDTDFGGMLANYGVDKKTGHLYIFDFGDLESVEMKADEFVDTTDLTNDFIIEALKSLVDTKIADYFRKNPFKAKDFYDKSGASLFESDLQGKDADTFKMTFPYSEKEIRTLFTSGSVSEIQLAARQPTAEEVRKVKAQKNRGDRLEFAAGLPNDDRISDRLNKELENVHEAASHASQDKTKSPPKAQTAIIELVDALGSYGESIVYPAILNLIELGDAAKEAILQATKDKSPQRRGNACAILGCWQRDEFLEVIERLLGDEDMYVVRQAIVSLERTVGLEEADRILERHPQAKLYAMADRPENVSRRNPEYVQSLRVKPNDLDIKKIEAAVKEFRFTTCLANASMLIYLLRALGEKAELMGMYNKGEDMPFHYLVHTERWGERDIWPYTGESANYERTAKASEGDYERMVDSFRENGTLARADQTLLRPVPGTRLISDIKPNAPFSRTVTSKKDLDKLVEEPLLDACRILYDKGLCTIASSANKKDIKHGYAYIDIAGGLGISSENRTIAIGLGAVPLIDNDEESDTFGEELTFELRIPITERSTVEEVRAQSIHMANQFVGQANFIKERDSATPAAPPAEPAVPNEKETVSINTNLTKIGEALSRISGIIDRMESSAISAEKARIELTGISRQVDMCGDEIKRNAGFGKDINNALRSIANCVYIMEAYSSQKMRDGVKEIREKLLAVIDAINPKILAPGEVRDATKPAVRIDTIQDAEGAIGEAVVEMKGGIITLRPVAFEAFCKAYPELFQAIKYLMSDAQIKQIFQTQNALVEKAEIDGIIEAFKTSKGNIARTAKLLGLKKSIIYLALEKSYAMRMLKERFDGDLPQNASRAPYLWSASRREVRRAKAKRNRGDRLELAAGHPDDDKISARLNEELKKSHAAEPILPSASVLEEMKRLSAQDITLEAAIKAAGFLDYKGEGAEEVRSSLRNFFGAIPDDAAFIKDSAVKAESKQPPTGLFSEIKVYYNDISQFPLLTHLGEVKFGALARLGDSKAREAMISSNLRLVVKIARKFAGVGMPIAELVEEGNIGLMKAVEKYEPKQGFKFSTYANWWIKQKIRRFIRGKSTMVRLPEYIGEAIQSLAKKCEREGLDFYDARTASVEIAKATGMPLEQLEKIRRAVFENRTLGMNGQAESSSDEGTGLEKITAIKPGEAEAKVDAAELASDAEKAIVLLRAKWHDKADRNEKILKLRVLPRLGLSDERERTLTEVGRAIGLTREAVRLIESQILNTIYAVRHTRRGPVGSTGGYLNRLITRAAEALDEGRFDEAIIRTEQALRLFKRFDMLKDDPPARMRFLDELNSDGNDESEFTESERSRAQNILRRAQVAASAGLPADLFAKAVPDTTHVQAKANAPLRLAMNSEKRRDHPEINGRSIVLAARRKRLKELLRKREFTMEELCARLGVTSATIYKDIQVNKELRRLRAHIIKKPRHQPETDEIEDTISNARVKLKKEHRAGIRWIVKCIKALEKQAENYSEKDGEGAAGHKIDIALNLVKLLFEKGVDVSGLSDRLKKKQKFYIEKMEEALHRDALIEEQAHDVLDGEYWQELRNGGWTPPEARIHLPREVTGKHKPGGEDELLLSPPEEVGKIFREERAKAMNVGLGAILQSATPPAPPAEPAIPDKTVLTDKPDGVAEGMRLVSDLAKETIRLTREDLERIIALVDETAVKDTGEQRFGVWATDLLHWYYEKSTQMTPLEKALAVFTYVRRDNDIFPNGNTRTAFLLMQYTLLKAGLKPFELSNEDSWKMFKAADAEAIRRELLLQQPHADKIGARRASPTVAEPLIVKIISEYVVQVYQGKGPGSDKLSVKEWENIYKAVSLFHSERIEIFMPKEAWLDEEMQNVLRDIRIRCRSDDIVICHEYSYCGKKPLGEWLDTPAKEGVKRIVVVEKSSADNIMAIVNAKPKRFEGVRLMQIALPKEYSSMPKIEQTAQQAKIITIAILARLFERTDATSMKEAILTAMLEGTMKDVSGFLNGLPESEGEANNPAMIVSRVENCLKNVISIVERIGEEIRFMKAFWTAA